MSYPKLEIEPGYLLGYHLTSEEHLCIRSWIRTQWEERILSVHPELTSVLPHISLREYHRLSERVVHEQLWAKEHRIFSKEQVDIFQQMSIFGRIREDLGDVSIADIEGLGYPEVYWRLVRPLPHIDVAVAHADTWFYQITNNISEQRQKRLCKCWLSIHSTPESSGLAVHAGSHMQLWKYGAEERHGRPKPVFLDDPNRLNLQTLPLSDGDGVVFHTHLIHKGIAHRGNYTRYSIEFALEQN